LKSDRVDDLSCLLKYFSKEEEVESKFEVFLDSQGEEMLRRE
jgi:hypothetical protein